MWEQYSKLIVHYRRTLTVGVWLVTVVAMAGLVPPLGPIKFDDRLHLVFKTGQQDYAQLQKLYADFGSHESDCYLLVESTTASHLFTPRAVAGLKHIVQRLEKMKVPVKGQMVHAIENVHSLADVDTVQGRGVSRARHPLLPKPAAPAADYERAREQALSHSLTAGHLLSEDARNTLIIARLSPELKRITYAGLAIDGFHDLAKEVAKDYPLRLRATGAPPIRVEVYTSLIRETIKFTVIAMVLSGLLGALLFRRLSLMVVSAVGPWAGSIWMMGFMSLAGEPLNIVCVVLPTLVIVLGFTNAIHLLSDIRTSLAEGQTAEQAAANAVRRVGGACALAALTTAAGFSSLLVSQSDVIQRFGLVCGIGVMVAFLAVITIVPLTAMVLLRSQQGEPIPAASETIGRGVDVLMDRMIRHRFAVTILGAVVTAALALTALGLRPDTKLTESIPKDHEACQTLERVEEFFGGALPAIIHLEWTDDPRDDIRYPQVVDVLTDVEKVVGGYEVLRHPMSVLNLLRSLPGGKRRPASQWYSLAIFPPEVPGRFLQGNNGRQAIVVTRIRNISASESEPIYRSIERRLKALEKKHPGFTLRLTGPSVVAARNIRQMIYDLAISLSLAGVVIFGMITIAFRSPRLGAISVLPNVFPLVCTSAVLVFAGRPLELGTVIVFTICLGIAADDTIHLINRFRYELRTTGNVDDALRRSGNAVGTALVTSTLVLLFGFSSLTFTEMPLTQLFAWYSSIGIGTALIGDLVILPAMLAWFAKPLPQTDEPRPADSAASASPSDAPSHS